MASSSSLRIMRSEKIRRRRMRERALVSPPTISAACMLLCAAVLALLPSKATATIFLPDFNRSYSSLPALFGKKLNLNEPPVTAYLTLIPNQPYMCPDDLKLILPRPPTFNTNNNMVGGNQIINNNSTTSNLMDYNTEIISNNTSDTSDLDSPSDSSDLFKDINPLPPVDNGLPVALLVERGMCTFHDKAIMASHYGPSVKYVIIYDDITYDQGDIRYPDKSLVPMGSDYETNMTLFFVSASTGHELLDIIHSQIMTSGGGNPSVGNDKNETESDFAPFLGYDIVVEIDGKSPVLNSYHALDMAAYFLAAMSGFLAFLVFFGCLLICAQCGCITAAPDEHGRIVLFAGGPGIRHTEGLARMIHANKLTRDQVMLLDEEEFEPAASDEGGENGAGDDDGDSSSPTCAICLEEFEPKQKLRVLPCEHKFCEDCLVPWLTQRDASCPLCKMDVLKYVGEIEKEQKKQSGEKESPDVPDGSASAATQTSSSPRCIWYRLRGWSHVTGSPETTEMDSEGSPRGDVEYSNDGSSHNRSMEGSEIEMEIITPRGGSAMLDP